MTSFHAISFDAKIGDAIEIVPVINGIELIDLVGEYEKTRLYEPAGGYGGIIPGYFNYGPLPQYYLGQSEVQYWRENEGIYVLGCDCGEVGCWPLVCRSYATEEVVTWDRFSQPHRPDWDYSEFGSFQFKRSEFRDATRRLVEKVSGNV